MAIRNVPMYQAKIPIRGGGGGGNIDLTNRPQINPIVAALQQIMQQKRQGEQDVLARRKTEADITYREAATERMGQPKGRAGKIVRQGGKTLLIDPQTGETITEIPTPPKTAQDILDEIANLTSTAETIPEDIVGTGVIEQHLGALGEQFAGIDPRTSQPRQTVINPKTGQPRKIFGKEGDVIGIRGQPQRKRVEAREVKGKRPPKPKEYPDAKWNEEHQLWTIVQNGRLKGIK